MTLEEYADLMKIILRMQINYLKEYPDYGNSDFLNGQEVGLMTAIEKIEASSFLFKS